MNKKLLFSGFVGIVTIGSLIINRMNVRELEKILEMRDAMLNESMGQFDKLHDEYEKLRNKYNYHSSVYQWTLRHVIEDPCDEFKKEILKILKEN